MPPACFVGIAAAVSGRENYPYLVNRPEVMLEVADRWWARAPPRL